jgi:hypothetical protein
MKNVQAWILYIAMISGYEYRGYLPSEWPRRCTDGAGGNAAES